MLAIIDSKILSLSLSSNVESISTDSVESLELPTSISELLLISFSLVDTSSTSVSNVSTSNVSELLSNNSEIT